MRRSRLSPAATLLLCACVWSPREGCSFNLGGGGFGNSDIGIIGEVPPDAIDSGRDSGDSRDSRDTCAVSLTDSAPEDGETGVSPYAEIALMFDGDLSPDQLSVAMADGTEGDLSGDGSLWIWRPRLPLRADHPYTLLITACGQQQTRSFTTGQAAGVAALLDGQTWTLDLNTAAPVAALDGLLPALLLRWSGAADSMAVQVAHADGSAQDLCLPAGSWSLQTRLPQLHLEGALTLSGGGARAAATGGLDLTVLEDGSAMVGSGGVLVTLDALSAIGVDTVALCSALTGASQCMEVGGAAFALLSLSGLSAAPISGAPGIVPVAAADCAGCEAGAPVCE